MVLLAAGVGSSYLGVDGLEHPDGVVLRAANKPRGLNDGARDGGTFATRKDDAGEHDDDGCSR